MPSLRKKFTSYIRQLSFHNEPRNKKNNINENAFVTKYLQGYITLHEGPPIIYGKNPTDLPTYELGHYDIGPDSILGCYSGPNGGLTTVRRTEKHLSVPDDDIDFIDTPEEETVLPPKPIKSPNLVKGQPIDNTTMVIKVAGNEYCVTNKPKRHSKSFSLSSIKDFTIEVEKTKIDAEFYSCDSKKDENSNDKEQNQGNEIICDKMEFNVVSGNEDTPSKVNSQCLTDNVFTNQVNVNERELIAHVSKQEGSMVDEKHNRTQKLHSKSSSRKLKDNIRSEKAKMELRDLDSSHKNYALSKSKSEGNPFHNKRRGKIIHAQRLQSYRGEISTDSPYSNDSNLPPEWNRKSECFYGISDSLYDRNQVTKYKNGDPIADCFGLIARNDSAILAVADGVNWGEKASIAAKSAIHASLHYLNKTIFNDTKPFDKLTIKTDDVSSTSSTPNPDWDNNVMTNTREVFVCLLRAFNCAHDLILENKGMLTTLTVAVVLPLRLKPQHSQEQRYVCCVCNVGDTLAYVYSQKYGIRELTKGSHDVNSNRDMRDALGALGPVDGINPELSNLTLSITTVNKGDMILLASDGLTDNFDPNVCRFTVNSLVEPSKNKNRKSSPARRQVWIPTTHHKHPELKTQTSLQSHYLVTEEPAPKPPVKPPRKSKTRGPVSHTTAPAASNNPVESSNISKVQSGNPSCSSETQTLTTTSHVPETATSSNLKIEPKQVKTENKKNPSVIENKASSLRKQASSQSRTDSARKTTPPLNSMPKTLETTRTKPDNPGYKFLKSKTSLDLRSNVVPKVQISRNEDGIPYVTPIQRYELQLLLMEDILKNGISGRDSATTTAKKLCENLVNFTISITSAKRRTLEDQDMYFDNRNGVLVEVSSHEKKLRRKKGLDRVQLLPGKLDHVTAVACNIGNFAA